MQLASGNRGNDAPAALWPTRRALLAGAPAWASRMAEVGLRLGVNLAGAEFGAEMPGRHGSTYIWPGNASADYYRAQGLDAFRIPFRWERLEHRPGAGFVPDEIGHLDRLVRHITGSGAIVILDVHNYGRWHDGRRARIVGENGPSAAAFASLWGRLAIRYRDVPQVMFGLMNEPHDQDMAPLLATLQGAIGAIRAAGATQRILVPGNHWSGGHSWVSSGNAEAMLRITDPADNFAFDIHQYLDVRSSGATHECVPGSGGNRLRPFTDWARANGRAGFLGEFNTGHDAACLAELAALLRHLQDNRDVWLGGTYWAGGPWWGENDFTVEPADLTNPVHRPQLTVLANAARSVR